MKTYNFLILGSTLILATGCASVSGWKPAVDSYGDNNAARIEFDMHECQSIASDSAGSTKNTLMGAGVSALVGGAGGAAIGAITGNPGAGAAIGAVALGLGGGAYKGLTSDQDYQSVFKNCMRNRGRKVL